MGSSLSLSNPCPLQLAKLDDCHFNKKVTRMNNNDDLLLILKIVNKGQKHYLGIPCMMYSLLTMLLSYDLVFLNCKLCVIHLGCRMDTWSSWIELNAIRIYKDGVECTVMLRSGPNQYNERRAFKKAHVWTGSFLIFYFFYLKGFFSFSFYTPTTVPCPCPPPVPFLTPPNLPATPQEG